MLKPTEVHIYVPAQHHLYFMLSCFSYVLPRSKNYSLSQRETSLSHNHQSSSEGGLQTLNLLSFTASLLVHMISCLI